MFRAQFMLFIFVSHWLEYNNSIVLFRGIVFICATTHEKKQKNNNRKNYKREIENKLLQIWKLKTQIIYSQCDSAFSEKFFFIQQ